MPRRFYYVHKDGWVTDDVTKVMGKCIRVIEATSKDRAEEIARRMGDID